MRGPPLSSVIVDDAPKPDPACAQLDNMDGPSSSMTDSSISDTGLGVKHSDLNDSILPSDNTSSLRYPAHKAWEEGDDSGSSATHTSMPDLEAQAELCEYLTNDLQDTTSHPTRGRHFLKESL